MDKWYAVPGYRGQEGFLGQPHVVNADGELVAACERIEDAENIARDHVGSFADSLQSFDMPSPELPEGLRPLPEGAVYLGKGGSFALPGGLFSGWCCVNDRDSWCYARWFGSSTSWHYAAPADSEIVKMNRRKG